MISPGNKDAYIFKVNATMRIRAHKVIEENKIEFIELLE